MKELKTELKLSLLRIEAAGYVPGKDVFIGFDCASSEFYDKERKVYDYTKFEGEGAAVRTAAEQIDYLEELVNKYPIITIEDGMMKTTGTVGKLLLNVLVVKFNWLVTTSS